MAKEYVSKPNFDFTLDGKPYSARFTVNVGKALEKALQQGKDNMEMVQELFALSTGENLESVEKMDAMMILGVVNDIFHHFGVKTTTGDGSPFPGMTGSVGSP